jgi:hypothetical protein
MGSGSDDLKTNIEHRTEEKEVIGYRLKKRQKTAALQDRRQKTRGRGNTNIEHRKR